MVRFVLLSVLMLLSFGPAHADNRDTLIEPSARLPGTRVALVIGVDHYARGTGPIFAPDLENPISDARAMRDTLGRLGFTVVYGEDLGKEAFEAALDHFEDRAKDADIALVYFSGHGATFENQPYLVPSDATFEELRQTERKLIRVEDVLSRLRGTKGVRVALFDACRDNEAEQALKQRVAGTKGIVQTRGLGRVAGPPDGLIVMYAAQFLQTADDRVKGADGQHSPFATALLQNLPTPGQDIKTVLFDVASSVVKLTDGRQKPELVIDLFDKFALVDVEKAPPVEVDKAISVQPSPDSIAANTQAVMVAPEPKASVQVSAFTATECNKRVGDILTKHGLYFNTRVEKAKKIVNDAANQCISDLKEYPNDGRLNSDYAITQQLLNEDDEALKYYRKAADLGSAEGMRGVGFAYRFGLGVDENVKTARSWYKKAADLGSKQAYYEMGLTYSAQGKDLSERRRWFQKASDAGNCSATVDLGNIYESPDLKIEDRDTGKAIKLYRKCAEMGDLRAMLYLSLGLRRVKPEIQKNLVESAEWELALTEGGFYDDDHQGMASYEFPDLMFGDSSYVLALRQALKRKGLLEGAEDASRARDVYRSLRKLAGYSPE